MEVTRKNFKDVLPIVEEAINNASFMSIDGEFTGLDVPHSSHVVPFDTPEERYLKIRAGSCDFLLLQLGLCTFQYNKDTGGYLARPFNFYVFPRPHSRNAPDCRFLCQSSSVDFLCAQGFDFNKVFRDGISYLNPSDESKMREALQQKHEQYTQFSSPAFVSPEGVEASGSKGPISIPEEQKEFMENICKMISEFLGKEEPETLALPSCNGFQRKLIYQTARQRFSGIHLESKTGEKKVRYIVVSRVESEEDLKKKELEKQATELAQLEDAIGFTKVVKMISQSGKLLIGHNMLLDLVHILHQFYFPLPHDYEDFKSMTRCAFPRLLDTKLMANTNPFRENIPSSTLGDLQKTLLQKPFCKAEVELPEEFSSYSETNDDNLHEAGYDAYITGLCFISMANYLGSFQTPPQSRVAPSSPLIEPFVNKLHLMRIIDIPYMNLAGEDLSPQRDHVFHLKFPKEWKGSDIHQLFSPFGNIYISWLDDTSAFVSLLKKEEAPSVLKSLNKDDTVYKITTHEKFKNPSSPRHYTKKRPMSATETDVGASTKKRKSLNAESDAESAPPFVSRSSSVTPPSKGEKNGQAGMKVIHEVPDSTSGKLSNEKLFEEPSAW